MSAGEGWGPKEVQQGPSNRPSEVFEARNSNMRGAATIKRGIRQGYR